MEHTLVFHAVEEVPSSILGQVDDRFYFSAVPVTRYLYSHITPSDSSHSTLTICSMLYFSPIYPLNLLCVQDLAFAKSLAFPYVYLITSGSRLHSGSIRAGLNFFFFFLSSFFFFSFFSFFLLFFFFFLFFFLKKKKNSPSDIQPQLISQESLRQGK